MPVMVRDAERGATRAADDLRDATACRRASSIPPSTSSPPTASAIPARRLPRTELRRASEVTIPLYPHMTEEEQDRVIDGLEEALAA